MRKTKVKLSGDALKNELWETIQGVKSKTVDPASAQAIASSAREIMRVVRMEFMILTAQNRQPTQKLLNGAGK